MKITESRLRSLIRNVIVEHQHDDDNDDNDSIYDPEIGDFDRDLSLDDDISYVEDQISDIRAEDEDREKYLEKFCKMFKIPRSEIENFLRNQAFESGYDQYGESFDDEEEYHG